MLLILYPAYLLSFKREDKGAKAMQKRRGGRECP